MLNCKNINIDYRVKYIVNFLTFRPVCWSFSNSSQRKSEDREEIRITNI